MTVVQATGAAHFAALLVAGLGVPRQHQSAQGPSQNQSCQVSHHQCISMKERTD